MNRIITIVLTTMLWTVSLAQDSESDQGFKEIMDQFSFALKAGTTPFGNSFGAGIAELGAAYNLNSHISVGLSAMGALGNCGYHNTEGVYVEFGEEDEGEDDPDEIEDDNDEECDSELDAAMGTLTYKISEQIPVFLQIAAGYSAGQNAPAYSALIGYHQRIVSGLGITGGIRFSEVLSEIPADALDFSRSGFKAELGIHWNF